MLNWYVSHAEYQILRANRMNRIMHVRSTGNEGAFRNFLNFADKRS